MSHDFDPIMTDAKCICEKARRLWLQPENDQSLYQAEWLYRLIWTRRTNATTTDHTDTDADTDAGLDNHVDHSIRHVSKKSKTENVPGDYGDDDHKNKSTCDTTTDWVRHAGEKLALMLLQSGRSNEADQILKTLQYTCRLSELLFNYPFEEEEEEECTAVNSSTDGPNQKNNYFTSTVPCRVYNHFVTKQEMHMFQTVFQDPNSDYWTHHHYSVEPPSPYVSYLIPLRQPPPNPSQPHDNHHGIVAFVHRLRNFLQSHFPVALASHCEMWAHNRYHATGHQFHFDSDNEGNTGRVLRNPICSCIVYLSDDKVGGPSIITNQRLTSHSLASKGWMCHPQLGRLVVFDGTVLHGVMPGKPVDSTLCINDSHHAGSEQSHNNSHNNNNPTGRRVSVMFAFWRKIRVRDHDTNVVGGAGAAQSFPESPEWAKQLRQPTDFTRTIATNDEIPVAVEAMTLDHIYVSTSSGRPWSRGMGMPNYDEIFQGF